MVALSSIAFSAVAAPAPTSAESSPAAQAAREIQAARDRANEASQKMFDAESEVDQLGVEIVDAKAELAAVEAQASAMRTELEAQAVRAFTESGTSTFPLLIDLDHANDELTAELLTSVARGNASVALDDFDAVSEQVDARRADLEARQGEADAAQQRFADLKATAEAEVVHLAEVEKQRLIDEAVQAELDRQREAREAVIAAQAAADAERAAADAQRAADESASKAIVSNASSNSASSGGSGSSGAAAAAPAAVAPQPAAAAPQPEPAPNVEAPNEPQPVVEPPSSNAGSGMICPIAGPRAFADTWGAARSAGRSHEGVDMMSPLGTPVVAVESGSVQMKTTSLGGNSAWVNGASGTRYFYAHLNGWEGSSRSVSQGEVIGYVGHTGNTTANHLHFEVHPGGGVAVNPYPYVRAVC
jgi:murein DD-endopeptidase MepM/ murein hydrolase activator NlpD